MGEKYTLKVDIDDSKIKELEKRLSNIMGLTPISGKAGIGGETSTGGLFKNLSKLAAIATGVGGTVVLLKKIMEKTVESSPMLKGMLKILDVGVMLILRPIGDFIGFFLRPLLIFFLTRIALPFYDAFEPLAIQFGDFFGDKVLKLISSPQGAAAVIITSLMAGWAILRIISGFLSALVNFFIKPFLPKTPTPPGEVPTGKVPTPKVPTGEVPTGKVPTGEVPTGKVSTPKIPTPKISIPKVPTLPKIPIMPSIPTGGGASGIGGFLKSIVKGLTSKVNLAGMGLYLAQLMGEQTAGSEEDVGYNPDVAAGGITLLTSHLQKAGLLGKKSAHTFTSGGRGSGGVIINFHIGNVSKDVDLEKIEPLVTKALQQANYRRGRVG